MPTRTPDGAATTIVAALAADPLVTGVTEGEVAVSGNGWAWLRTVHGPVHLIDPRGAKGPRAIVAACVPPLTPGATVTIDTTSAAPLRSGPLPTPAATAAVAAACATVYPFAWSDADAQRLGREPLAELLPRLIGRGPGLTPAGDDAVCGYLAARLVVAPSAAAEEVGAVRRSVERTTEISAALLDAAATTGRIFDAGMAMLAALLSADGQALAPAVRRLQVLGQTTGRALLTGLVGGLTATTLAS